MQYATRHVRYVDARDGRGRPAEPTSDEGVAMSQSCVPAAVGVEDESDGGAVVETLSVGDQPRIWVELEVELGPDHACPLTNMAADAEGDIQLAGDTCHLTLEVRGDDGRAVTTVATEIDDQCICPAICGEGFAPAEMTVHGGSLAIGAYARDRQALGDATGRIERVAERWHLRRLASSADSHHGTDSCASRLADLNLTEKQREAVQTAVDEGYYRNPRETSLGELAEELNITRSALSQRLNAVESKLVTSLTDDLD